MVGVPIRMMGVTNASREQVSVDATEISKSLSVLPDYPTNPMETRCA